MPVADIDIDLDEFAHHLAYERINPYPDMRNEFMLAQLCAYYVSAHSKDNKVNPSNFTLTELLDRKQAKVNNRALDNRIKAAFSSLRTLTKQPKTNG